MKRDKVSIGQCYEKGDHIYMVLLKYPVHKAIRMKIAGIDPSPIWITRDILTKDYTYITEKELKAMRRPFENFG